MTFQKELNSQDTPKGPAPIYKDLLLLQIAALAFITDQFTKFLVQEFLRFQESFPRDGLFRITHTFNTGTAFGLFQGNNLPLVMVSIIGVTVLLIIYRTQQRPSNLLRLSLGLQLGGAAGNLLDRLRLGHVIDFVDIGIWPTFNVADASIVIGMFMLVWAILGPKPEAAKGPGSAAAVGMTMLDGSTLGSSWCPICEGDMRPVSGGWRCSTCGELETVLPGQ